MATTFVATTPTRAGSPASSSFINTPPTPRLGSFADNWEPYSPAPRKSARLSSRTSNNRTPSPHSSGRNPRPSHTRALPKTSSSSEEPQSNQSRQTSSMTSPPATSPQKKRQPTSASRSVSGSLTAESIRNAAAALGQSEKMDHLQLPTAGAALALPTPSKTPARKHTEQSEKDVNAIARNLFGRQQSPKKTRAKRSTEIPLDSFEIHDDEAPIQIFTDSENRLPQADGSSDNPFYGEAGIAASTAPVRRSSRNKKSIAVEEKVEETLQREDGLLYVFRGKKVFRKFAEGEAVSRPAVKPRLLFPSTKGSKENEIFEDEEAETDIEEPVKAAQEDAATPAAADEGKVDTPKAPRFAPASPPSTSRATRSKKLIFDEPTPIKFKGKRGGGSPFDSWRRTKNSPSTSAHGQKRAGEPLASDPAPKRPKI